MPKLETATCTFTGMDWVELWHAFQNRGSSNTKRIVAKAVNELRGDLKYDLNEIEPKEK
jgi:hypothetical protein